MTTSTFPEVPALDVADAIVRAHENTDTLDTQPGSTRFLHAARDFDALLSSADRNATASEEAGRTAEAPRAPLSLGAVVLGGRDSDTSDRTAPRTLERALLELGLIPETGWSSEQAERFRAAAISGSRTPADLVQLVGFLRSWHALPRTAAAVEFACTLLGSEHSVSAIERSVGGVWSYSRRQSRDVRSRFTPEEEARLVQAALANPRPGKQTLLVLDAVDNDGGFSAYRRDLRLTALEAALRSPAEAQDALQWALDARAMGIDDEADVAVFVRLLTQP
ncbi:MAG: hypothetical protein JWM98_2939 [Thermoleophilia bacterium]|nr:hypothetical protein [Thermoleophilia bacterium]